MKNKTALVKYFTKNPYFFNSLLVEYYNLPSNISYYSKNYPFDSRSLNHFKHRLDWKEVCYNKYLRFNDFFPQDYMSYINWKILCSNPYLNWNVEVIEKYQENIDWKILSQNYGLPWTIDLIDHFKHLLNWDKLVKNEGVKWNVKMIIAFQDLLFGGRTSICINEKIKWDQHLIDSVSKKMSYTDFENLSYNTNVKWTYSLVEKYKDRLNWRGLHNNPSLPWNEKFVEKYKERFAGIWGLSISNNKGIRWNAKMLHKFKDDLNWVGICSSTNINWTIGLIEKFEKYIQWHVLCSNESIDFNKSLLERFWENIQWDILILNKKVLIDNRLFFRIKDKITWVGSYLWEREGGKTFLPSAVSKCHKKIPIRILLEKTKEWRSDPGAEWDTYSRFGMVDNRIIKEFKDKLNYSLLLRNPNFDWSFDRFYNLYKDSDLYSLEYLGPNVVSMLLNTLDEFVIKKTLNEIYLIDTENIPLSITHNYERETDSK